MQKVSVYPNDIYYEVSSEKMRHLFKLVNNYMKKEKL